MQNADGLCVKYPAVVGCNKRSALHRMEASCGAMPVGYCALRWLYLTPWDDPASKSVLDKSDSISNSPSFAFHSESCQVRRGGVTTAFREGETLSRRADLAERILN